MEPGSQETQPEVHGNTYRKSYEVSGVNIDVNYRILSPKKEHLDSKTGNPISPASDTFLVFMPGWAVDAGTKTAEVTGQAFAEAGNQRVFTIDTKPDTGLFLWNLWDYTIRVLRKGLLEDFSKLPL